ncbi:hypothetical protein [uncultured Polaribacter sp.]|uniref:hypothetical protein n=1 Tax=uncultured Polaribacter sp. TaxID=174711 RepID=UPI00260EB463|nr:hypothetical protein [uncultured Polaribacter sp.]
MANKSMIKCANCGLFNTDTKICTNCNTLLNPREKELTLKKEAVKKAEIAKVIYDKENPNFAERLKQHPFFLYKIIGWILYSAFMTISIIGSGLAWFIAMIAAG